MRAHHSAGCLNTGPLDPCRFTLNSTGQLELCGIRDSMTKPPNCTTSLKSFWRADLAETFTVSSRISISWKMYPVGSAENHKSPGQNVLRDSTLITAVPFRQRPVSHARGRSERERRRATPGGGEQVSGRSGWNGTFQTRAPAIFNTGRRASNVHFPISREQKGGFVRSVPARANPAGRESCRRPEPCSLICSNLGGPPDAQAA